MRPAIHHARRWLALDSLHEPAHQTLMRRYALPGRQAAALRQFDECQRILQEELVVEPDAETQALAAAIRAKRIRPTVAITDGTVNRPAPVRAVDLAVADGHTAACFLYEKRPVLGADVQTIATAR